MLVLPFFSAPLRVALRSAAMAGVLVASGMLVAGPAGAQSAPQGKVLPMPPATGPQAGPPQAPDARPPRAPDATDATRQATTRPKISKDKRTQLEGLFAALKAAPDDTSSKVIADRLDQIFSDSGSPTADLLMARAGVAAEAKQYDLAFSLLDQVLTLEPDYVGALSKRATLYYLKDDYGAALADIREVLAREPRHFAMLYGFALILKEIGEEKRALTVLRNALDVNPRLENGKEMEEQLAVTVEGRGI